MRDNAVDNAVDPTSWNPRPPVVCEGEVGMLVAMIRQAFEDADRIGRCKRMTGETAYVRDTEAKAERMRAEETKILLAWMHRDVRHGIESLDGVCEEIEAATGQRVDPETIRSAIEAALLGATPPGLLAWRSVGVVGRNPWVSERRDYRAERRRQRTAQRITEHEEGMAT